MGKSVRRYIICGHGLISTCVKFLHYCFGNQVVRQFALRTKSPRRALRIHVEINSVLGGVDSGEGLSNRNMVSEMANQSVRTADVFFGRKVTKTKHHENMSVFNVYPLIPNFSDNTVVCRGISIFLILLQSIDCGYSLEPPSRGGSNVYLQSVF